MKKKSAPKKKVKKRTEKTAKNTTMKSFAFNVENEMETRYDKVLNKTLSDFTKRTNLLIRKDVEILEQTGKPQQL